MLQGSAKNGFNLWSYFFAGVLLIPFLSGISEWWYAKKIWGGFTPNYLVVALLYHIFYVLLGYFYAKQANDLEDRLLGSKDRESEVKKS